MATGSTKHDSLENVASIQTVQNNRGILFTMKDGNSFQFFIGALDATHNYVQFLVNGVDKGYITFTVSRNV